MARRCEDRAEGHRRGCGHRLRGVSAQATPQLAKTPEELRITESVSRLDGFSVSPQNAPVTNLSETLDLIRDGAVPRDLESEQLEFKQEESADPRRSLGMLADAVVCLANAEGGTIVVGVVDAVGGPAALRGCRRD